jgi:hypothetical protein
MDAMVPVAGDAALADAATAAVRRGAGMAVVLASFGMAAGWVVGGVHGAGAGLLLVGAARNALRARADWRSPDESMRAEAAKSATMAIAGIALGGYLIYDARSRREG